MFGELIGFFIVNLWQQMGQPTSFTLLELGPGRGTLMQDALRAASKADGFENALHLQLFETNAILKAEQEKRLGQYTPYWASEIDAVSDDPIFVIANEFFDALPIRQFVKTDDGWHERLVGLNDGKRAFGLSPTPIAESRSARRCTAPSPAKSSNCRLPRRRHAALAAQGRAAGRCHPRHRLRLCRARRPATSLQAVKDHAFADLLEAPGEADLSSHVEFRRPRRGRESGGPRG